MTEKRERWAHVLPRLQKDRFAILHHEKMKNVSPHSHVFFELSYVVNGEVEHSIHDKKSVLSKGNYFLVDYGSIHSYRAIGEDGFENLDCLFLPEFLDPALKGEENLGDLFRHYLVNFDPKFLSQNPANMVFSDPDGRVLSLLKEIHREKEKGEAGYGEMVRCHLIQILLLTLRRLPEASLVSGNQKNVFFFVPLRFRSLR